MQKINIIYFILHLNLMKIFIPITYNHNEVLVLSLSLLVYNFQYLKSFFYLLLSA